MNTAARRDADRAGEIQQAIQDEDRATQAADLMQAARDLEAPVRPDPTRTGPCELKLSFACTDAGYERLDPRDMLAPETSFRTPRIICLPCYELAADHYIGEVHS